jgi:hypothetical protein
MKKQFRTLLVLFLFACPGKAFSQNYQTAAGLKFYPGALTVKHFIKQNAALEGLLYAWSYGLRITALYEYHAPIKEASGLQWYAGGGIHFGAWNDRWRDRYDTYYSNNPYRSGYVGLDGVLGLDYKIKDAPLNLSLDWQPSFNFGDGPGNYGFYSGLGGLAIRYTFK